ncbi:MAG: type II toxin-antitoxin system PemK/MazF family toxin [Ignavibacteria bacterium]|nr:type II toxin-antitoxin system PemK/MazF family toxin [Ignavibacteria bacterium]
MVIKQGDIYWVNFGKRNGSKPLGLRPAVVIQSNIFNESAINTVIVAAVTSQLKYENLPGNIRLMKGEAKIPKASVINVSSITIINKDQLVEKIGQLSATKIQDLKKGIKLIFDLE